MENLDTWADDKGIRVMGTGDFTHPAWFKEIETKLRPAEPGLFKLREAYKKKTMKGTTPDTRFLLTVEISSIYSRGGKTRRVHNLVFAPDLETARKINTHLSRIGNIASDGRPILGLDSEELVKIVLDASPEAVVIPAHAWTPWFSVFGSMSGFNSLEECFGQYAKYIFAIETGLSSDPAMNWRLSKLDHIALISNSDSHSLERIGREANIFDTDLSYAGIMGALKSRDSKKFIATLEFFPEEGKYHYDGHRSCGVRWSPEETKKSKGICPVCRKRVTVGVMSRVDDLADRSLPALQKIKFGEVNTSVFPGRTPYISLVSLDEVIGEAFNLGRATKTVKQEYEKLIRVFGSELSILMDIPLRELEQTAKPEVTEGIRCMRKGQITIEPGYDGEFGTVRIFTDESRKNAREQSSLF